MRYRFIFLVAVLLLSACSTESVADHDAKTNVSGAVKTKPTAAEIAAKEKADTESVSDAANRLLKSVTVKFEKAQSKWIEKNARIKDSKARQAHFKSRPCLKYADQLVEMAEKYPDTEAAKLAWPIAAKYGMGETKSKASKAVLAAAMAEADPAKSMESLEFLMKYTFLDPQKEAMELMLSRAMEHKDSESAFDIIKKIVCSPRGIVIYGDVFLPPGNKVVREKAIKRLWAMVEADVKSETAIECLNLMYENGSEKTQDDAIA